MTLDELIKAIDSSIEGDQRKGLFWGMQGPPMAYFEVGTEDHFSRFEYETVAWIAPSARTPEVEAALCKKMLLAFQACRERFSADSGPVLFWRYADRIKIEEEGERTKVRTRVCIPGTRVTYRKEGDPIEVIEL